MQPLFAKVDDPNTDDLSLLTTIGAGDYIYSSCHVDCGCYLYIAGGVGHVKSWEGKVKKN